MTNEPKLHEVQVGECLASISERYGFVVDTLWDHPDNAELRALRGSPYVLEPGDQVVIPAKTSKSISLPTGRRHTFRRRGVPERLRLQLVDHNTPEAQLPYRLKVSGITREGQTDDDGWIEEWIPPGARHARLVLDPDGERPRELSLALGRLDPPDTEAGVRARLFNLGYLEDSQAPPAELLLALCRFQLDEDLEVDGIIDDATATALVNANGA